MGVLQVYPCRRKISLLILKEEREASTKEQHQDRKRIFLFSKVGYLMEKQLAFQSLFYLKIKISEARIMRSKEVFQDPGMLIGWRIRSLADLKIIVVVDTLVQE